MPYGELEANSTSKVQRKEDESSQQRGDEI